MQLSSCKDISCASPEQTTQYALDSECHSMSRQELQELVRSIEGRLPASNSYKASSTDPTRTAPAVWQCRLKGESQILVGLSSLNHLSASVKAAF